MSPAPPPLRVSSRPAFVAALALALGIALGRAVPDVSANGWLAALGAAGALAGGYALASRGRLVHLRTLAAGVFVLGGLVAAGAARLALGEAPRPDGLGEAAEAASAAAAAIRGSETDAAEPITLWGRVATTPIASPWSVRFAAHVDSAARGTAAGRVRERVQVTLAIAQPGPGREDVAAPVFPALRPGDRVRLTGRLATPPERRNPADMDYGAFLRGQGVGATLRVEASADVAFLAPALRLRDRVASRVQRHVRRAVARHVPDAHARSVLLALLLADRSRIEAETLVAFRETGLMHLLAVSGLHVLLAGMALYGLLGPLLRRTGLPNRHVEAARSGATLAVLVGYALATGAPVSVVRAVTMAAVVLVGRAAQQRSDTLNALGIAALGLLLYRPAALFEVGFQLSFAAVLALVTLSPVLTAAVPERLRRTAAGRWTTASLVASVAATLGTAPVLLAHFGRVPVGGLVLNLPAIPLTAVTLGSGFATAASAGWSPLLADAFGAVAVASARVLLWTSEAGAHSLGGIAVDAFVTDPLALAALVLGLGAVAVGPRAALRRRLALAAVGLAAGAAWLGVARGDARPRLDLVVLDVGQGDAVLLSLGGRHLLVDAGNGPPGPDAGLRTVVPHLRRYGIRHLDALVLTHPHADHIGGAASVLEAVSVGRVVHNGQDAGDRALWARVLHVADSLGVPLRAVRAGDTLDVGPHARVRVLGPSPALAAAGDANEASVALHVAFGRTRVLLSGDAEHAAEADLVARYGALLRADVVKVGHHGSRTSSTPAFVAAATGVAPGVRLVAQPDAATAHAVVSVARRNRYNLPNPEPLGRWDAAGARTLETATEGAVWLRSDGRAVARVRWR